MKEESGGQFDPGVLELFLDHFDEALTIQGHFPDEV